jgi:Flp pilus assembly protein TadD
MIRLTLAGLLLAGLQAAPPAAAQQGATEVDQLPPRRAAPSRLPRNAPRRDISAELATAQERIDAQDWLGAATELARARDRDPANMDVLNILGYCQRRGGDLYAALDTFTLLIKQVAQHRSAHEQIGKTYLLLGRPDDAQRHLIQLQKICGNCYESLELDQAIGAYLR